MKYESLKPSRDVRHHFLGTRRSKGGGGAQAWQDILDPFGLLDGVQAAALSACDELAFFKLAVSRMGSAPLTPQNVISGVNALGTSFASTQTYGTSFSAAKHDGVDLVRNYRWIDSCKCFHYTSGAYRP